MDGDIINSPITAAEASDAPIIMDITEETMSTDSITSTDLVGPRGKKRGRKPKGSNIPGSRSFSKMNATRMDGYEDDVLDNPDFFKITKKDRQMGKKRKLQECPGRLTVI